MTDYLEPRQGENEDALWETVRRLNALLRNTGGGPGGAEERAELSSGEKPGEGELLLLPLLEEMTAADRALSGEPAKETAVRESGNGTDRSGNSSLSSPDGSGNSPLSSPDGDRGGSIPRSGLLSAGGEAERRFNGREAAWPDETLQAERLDQVFRRDSRRYDGGFFLY